MPRCKNSGAFLFCGLGRFSTIYTFSIWMYYDKKRKHMANYIVDYGFKIIFFSTVPAVIIWICFAAYDYYKYRELAEARKISRARWIPYLSTASDIRKKTDLSRLMLDCEDITLDELRAIYVNLPKTDFPFWEKDYGLLALNMHEIRTTSTKATSTSFSFLKYLPMNAFKIAKKTFVFSKKQKTIEKT